GSAVDCRNPDQDVVRRRLRVLDEHVEVAIAVEDTGVDELVFALLPAAPRVLLDEFVVRERRVRVLVQELHVRVRRGAVEIKVLLLDGRAVVALRAAQAEETFLQDAIASVPERQREAHMLVSIADAPEPVLVPAIRAEVRVLERKVLPGVAAGAVVLADGAP